MATENKSVASFDLSPRTSGSGVSKSQARENRAKAIFANKAVKFLGRGVVGQKPPAPAACVLCGGTHKASRIDLTSFYETKTGTIAISDTCRSRYVDFLATVGLSNPEVYRSVYGAPVKK